MKAQHSIWFTGLLVALLTVTSLPANARASTQEAEFTSKQGQIVTPSFNFGSHTLGELPAEFPAIGFDNVDHNDTYNGSELSITSTHARGYTVGAKLLSMTNDTGETLDGVTLNLKPSPMTGTDAIGAPSVQNASLRAGGDAQTIIQASQNEGRGTYTSDLTNTTLSIDGMVREGSYKASIQYTIEQAPELIIPNLPDDYDYLDKMGTGNAYIKGDTVYVLDGDIAYREGSGKNVKDFLEKASQAGFNPTKIDTTTAFVSISESDNKNKNTFSDLPNIESINASDTDVGVINNFNYMFANDPQLKTINIQDWQTPNASSFRGMFANTPQLKNITIDNINGSNVRDMAEMFMNTGLETFNMYLDTSNVSNMSSMFEGSQMKELDLYTFNTGKVDDMSRMFAKMPNLTTLDIQSFSTRFLSNAKFMFTEDKKLSSLSLSTNFNTPSQSIEGMFKDSNVPIDAQGLINNWRIKPRLNQTDAFNGANWVPTWYTGAR